MKVAIILTASALILLPAVATPVAAAAAASAKNDLPVLSSAKAELIGRVEDFFLHNFHDITWRKSLAWGDVHTDADGVRSISYDYEAKIWDKETLAMKQTFTISDPGGNRTDFQISARGAGVQVSPTSGTTPATVTVTVDPAAMTNTFGTVAVNLDITSGSAVNVIPPVRLLISNPDQDQRGSVVNIPGTLTDLVADRDRRRFYVVRRDKNQILVFDGTNNQQRCGSIVGL